MVFSTAIAYLFMRYLRKTTASCASMRIAHSSMVFNGLVCMHMCVMFTLISIKNASKSQYLHNKLYRLDIWAFLLSCFLIFFLLFCSFIRLVHLFLIRSSQSLFVLFFFFYLTSIFANTRTQTLKKYRLNFIQNTDDCHHLIPPASQIIIKFILQTVKLLI